ncbi:MAG: TPM domain-containing protein, partial [Clostridia bacterium]|nr:TPM domain-containing protein [Clostridia bacterium]
MKTKSGKHTNLFKRLCLAAAVALLCALITLAAAATDGSSAATGKTYVHDLAGLLTESERASIEAKLKDVSSRTGIDVGLLTDDDYTSDYAAQDKADLFAEQNFSEDNVLLFIDLSTDRSDRYWHISSSGLGITVLTDSGIDEIFDELEAKAYAGYASQISAFASKVSEFTDYYR